MTRSLSPPFRRRWFQFGLGTFLAIISAVAVFFAYHVNWIHERHQFRTLDYIPSVAPIGPPQEVIVPAPGLLRLFGERGHCSVELEFNSEEGHLASGLTVEEEKERDRVKRLFPEAHINWHNSHKKKRAQEYSGDDPFNP